MSEKAKLVFREKEYEFDVIEGSEGELAINTGQLRAATSLITLDSGYANTGACKSAITFLDGEQGILRYRGYPIEELAAKSTFLEVAYLLIYGELPTKSHVEEFVSDIKHHTMLNQELVKIYEALPRDAHPMATLSAVAAVLSTYYQDSLEPKNRAHVEISIRRLIAKFPTIAAYAYKKSLGQPYVFPKNRLSYAGNFLNMMFSLPAEEYVVDPLLEEALNVLLILHADHEQNCSTSTMRLVGSSHANVYACVSAAICALWGPRHGGANQHVIEMLQRIQADGGDVNRAIARAKDKTDSFLLMGFGHRVYRNYDPRAKIIKATADKVLGRMKQADPLLDIAKRLEEAALKDSYFVDRKLYPNVDFYSGLIYRAMGFPTNMFTVLFTLGRLPGWIAQWKEMLDDPDERIGRPRQVYTGPCQRPYVPIEQR